MSARLVLKAAFIAPLYEKSMAWRHPSVALPLFDAPTAYSTVTDLARLRGWSTSVPSITAVW
jgi:hypothetical protein